MSIGDNIKYLRRLHNLSQDEFGKIAGVSDKAVSTWETGVKTPRMGAIQKIADYFGIAKSDIIEDKIISEKSNLGYIHPQENIYQIPVFESVSAGFGAYANNEILDYLPVVLNSRYEAENTLAIKVKGDSMYPKIEDGDIIIVRKQNSVDSGDIAVLLLNGEEGLVKKVLYGDDWIVLHSVNPEYKDRKFEKQEVLRLQIIGKVIGSYKSF